MRQFPRRRSGRARAVAGVAGGLGIGALSGFVGSLLRRRPPSTYVGSLRSPVAGPEPKRAYPDQHRRES
ncbi:MAG: hypothetical protein H0U36_03855 [Nocardioidaceae bacterium]|nr:hypothetical protein [Nocardioidaceae bacterium]